MAALAADEAAQAQEKRNGPNINPYRGNLHRHGSSQGGIMDVPWTGHLNLEIWAPGEWGGGSSAKMVDLQPHLHGRC